jgi:hypothetical protein
MDGDNPTAEDRARRTGRERAFVMDRDRKATRAAAIRALKDHSGDAAVMIPRDVAASLRRYLAKTQRTPDGMETHRAEADGMDEELSALNKALKEGGDGNG